MADINNLTPAEISMILDRKIGMFFGACSVAFRNVENMYFLDLITTLLKIHPDLLKNYKPPTRQTLSNTIIPFVLEDLDKEKQKLLDNTESVLLLDGWHNSSNNKKFLVFTLRNQNTNQVFLKFEDYSKKTEDHDSLGKSIVDAIKLAKDKYNTYVFGVTNDNNVKVKAGASTASDMLREENIYDESLFLSTCMSHSGNLLIKTIIKDIFLTQLRDVVTAFSSPRMTALLYDHGGCKLKNYPDTRFCFVYLTCERIWKSLDAIKSIIMSRQQDVEPKIKSLIDDVSFEREIWQTMRLLKPICCLINKCQDGNVNIADGTEEWLKLSIDNPELAEFEGKIQERINAAVQEVGYAANLMHNVYRGERMDEDQTEVAKKFLKEKLSEEGKAELDRFFRNRNLPDKFAENCKCPSAYWSLKEFTYPNVSKLCRRLMLMPASTALLEGFFSQWTFVHNKYRNRLSNKTTGNLIDLYHLSKHLERGVWTDTAKKRKREHLDFDDDCG